MKNTYIAFFIPWVFVSGCSLVSTNTPAPVVSVNTHEDHQDHRQWKTQTAKTKSISKRAKPQSRFEILPGPPEQGVQTRSPKLPTSRFEEVPYHQLSTSKGDWIWPYQGKVLKRFTQQSGQANKGIDIKGNRGDPVLAARSGKVVYSGSGLRGYGQLIIIKHNDGFLSAYAHNQQLLVKEGDTITQGQKIAEMGNSGTDSVKLHFEIRKNGKPMNPLEYLPKRQST